jgi:hypothetical protein
MKGCNLLLISNQVKEKEKKKVLIILCKELGILKERRLSQLLM